MSTVKQPIVEEYNQGILDFTLPDSYVAIAANKTLHYMTWHYEYINTFTLNRATLANFW